MVRALIYTLFVLLIPVAAGGLIRLVLGVQAFDNVGVMIDVFYLLGWTAKAEPIRGVFAAYLLLLAITLSLNALTLRNVDRHDRRHRKRLDGIGDKLLGEWNYKADFKVAKRDAIAKGYRSERELASYKDDAEILITVNGSATITRNDYGRIRFEGAWTGQHLGGSWTADEIILKPTGMSYFFRVPGDTPQIVIDGVTELSFNSEKSDKIRKMNGRWRILGERAWGKIEFDRS